MRNFMTENTLTIAYISLSGNTQSFVKRLGEYLKEHYQLESKTINIKELKHETFPVTSPLSQFYRLISKVETGLTQVMLRF